MLAAVTAALDQTESEISSSQASKSSGNLNKTQSNSDNSKESSSGGTAGIQIGPATTTNLAKSKKVPVNQNQILTVQQHAQITN